MYAVLEKEYILKFNILFLNICDGLNSLYKHTYFPRFCEFLSFARKLSLKIEIGKLFTINLN